LAAVEGDAIGAEVSIAPANAAAPVPRRRLHLDDVRAVEREQHAAVRAGHALGQIDDHESLVGQAPVIRIPRAIPVRLRPRHGDRIVQRQDWRTLDAPRLAEARSSPTSGGDKPHAREDTLGARTGEQFLDRLRKTRRTVWLGDEMVDDVTAHPALAGAATTLAGVFDRQHRHAAECLVPDPNTGETMNISHMIPRSIADLERRNQGLTRISEATVGLMGRTPDYMNVKFACFAARHAMWAGADRDNEQGALNLVRFQRYLAREDVSLTHTIIQPTIDKATD